MTVSEVAELLRVDPQTVRKYAQSGRLKGFKTGEGDRHHWRFTKDQLVEFMVNSATN
jgi:excisionase family DNA binding protein